MSKKEVGEIEMKDACVEVVNIKNLDVEFDEGISNIILDSKQRTSIDLLQRSFIIYIVLLSFCYVVSICLWIIIICVTEFVWMKDIKFYYFVFLVSMSIILSFVLFLFNFFVLIFVNKCYVERKIKSFGVKL